MSGVAGRVAVLADACERFLARHRVGGAPLAAPLDGGFSLYPGADEDDLYGLVDAVYVLSTIGRLERWTDAASRRRWADRILDHQDGDGWFTRRNLRGHPREHATAYAIGALLLLELEAGEDHRGRLRPLDGVRPLVEDLAAAERWLRRMGLEGPLDPLRKNLGWQYVWRGSHVGGGVAAALGMCAGQAAGWWPQAMPVERWLDWYFGWLDAECDRRTGYWRRALWNLVVRRPTLVDLGGAAHFLWIYAAAGRPFPYPEATLASTLGLQRGDGLYQELPYCIDLDADFAILRAWEQLDVAGKERWRPEVERSLTANFDAALGAMTGGRPLGELYSNLHTLPGALAALTECARWPGFPHAAALATWNHPLERAWWL